MSPERSWFLQARSDYNCARILEANGGDVCQILMHLQMCGEKLVKGYARRSGSFRPVHNAVHNWFPYLRAVIVGSPHLREKFMGRSASRAEVIRVLNSLEKTLPAVERLNPSVAGWGNPNCGYPWEKASPPAQGYPALCDFVWVEPNASACVLLYLVGQDSIAIRF